MKRIYIALFAFCALLLAVPAQAQSSQQGPPMPEMLAMEPSQTAYDKTSMYMEEFIWKLREKPFQETKNLADQMSAWMKWAQQMVKEMQSGARETNYDLLAELNRGIENWEDFYSKMVRVVNIMALVDLKPNSQGQWSYRDVMPLFLTGVNVSHVPYSQVDAKGNSIKMKGAKVSYVDEKRPFRFGDIIDFPNKPSVFQPMPISQDKVEVATRDMNMALNIALLFEGFPVQGFNRDNYGTGITRAGFDIAYHKALFYYEAVKEAIANNGAGTTNLQPMPKAGGMHASMKAKVLAIEKGITKDVVDVVITSDAWLIDRNAAGQPIRRVIFGYSIVNTPNGKMATRVSWAEDHQGGGKYGALHAYGNGTESFYVK